jgi:hypothetical protein
MTSVAIVFGRFFNSLPKKYRDIHLHLEAYQSHISKNVKLGIPSSRLAALSALHEININKIIAEDRDNEKILLEKIRLLEERVDELLKEDKNKIFAERSDMIIVSR